MNPFLENATNKTRRHFFKGCGVGLGAMAMASLDNDKPVTAEVVNPLAPRQPHFAAKAKRVIYLHMAGSPPHLDLFDYKPELVKRTDEPCPDEFYEGKRFAFTRADRCFWELRRNSNSMVRVDSGSLQPSRNWQKLLTI